uniref:ENTH domain-containing protein n=1 Tax=Bursaphelenchus xylophilus TaxID=6326 RepID=A0A1I7RLS1_BURXY
MKNRTPASLRAANSDSLNGNQSTVESSESFTMSDLFSGLANLTKQVSTTLNSYEIRKLADKAQGYVLNFTEVELKVREATNEDPWGPTGPQIQEIAQLTNQYDAFPEVMGMLWKRMLQDTKLAWRRVYKSLMLLQGLIKLGNERVISNARDHLFEMRALENYKCVDERGRDQGVNIRHRVKQIIELLQDDELLVEERRKARGENKDKYQGYSKEDMMMKGGVSSSKSSSFDNWDRKSSGGFNSRKDKFDDLPEPKSSREVTAFDFDDGRQRTASPELGIPDHSQSQPVDDDEFGDFADARGNSGPAGNQSSAYNTLGLTRAKAPSNDLFATPIQPPAPSSQTRPRPPSGPSSPVQAPAKNEASLFDLDFDAPAPQPAAISGFGTSQNAPAFDLFASQPIQQAPQPAADLFGDFTAPVQSPVQSPVQPTASLNSGIGKPSDLDDIFGSFGAAPAATPVAQPQPILNNISNGLSNGNGVTKPVEKSDAWSLMEKQLDGLTLGSNAQKKAPTMNEMMRR